MKWMRYTAFGIGIAFGSVFLLFNLEGPFDHVPGFWETLPLLTGPVTLLLASLVGLKFEKVAGWLLVAGAAATAFLFTTREVRGAGGAPQVAVIVVVFCLPMLCSGVLWLAHADFKPRDGAHLPWMS